MKIADLGQLGYLPLQCFDARYALEVRPAVFATRIEKRWSDTLGRYVQERKSSGDVLCSFLWGVSGVGLPAAGGAPIPGGGSTVSAPPGGLATAGGLGGRKIPGWAFGWPVITTGDATSAPKGDDDVNAYANPGTTQANPNFGGGFGGIPQTQEKPKASSASGGSVSVLPVYDAGWTPDARFSQKTIASPPGIPAVPAGTVGLAFAGTRELSQEELFFPIGVSQPLVATHFGGDFWRSTHVHDLTNENKLDQVMKAKLHQLLRVYEVPRHCGADTSATVGFLGRPGNHSLALQMGTARGGIPGNLLFADDRWLGAPDATVQDHGVATNRLSGPLSVGTCTKHLYYPQDPANTKGERFRPLHLDPNTYWDMRHYGCGPMEFTRIPYPRNAKDNGIPTKVYLSYDALEPHAFTCGERLGEWRWWTTTPLYKPGTGRQSVPGEEEGFLTKPGLAPDPNWTVPGDANDEGGGSTPGTDPDPGTDTTPEEDQHFTTDPEKEAFHSLAGTLADPGLNASHNVRDIGVPGLTEPDTDPWIDGPAVQPGAAPGSTPTGHSTFGFGFLEPITPAAALPAFPDGTLTRILPPPPTFDSTQTARARAGAALDYLAIPTELGFSGLVARAQPVAPGVAGYQNVFGWGPQDAAYVDSITPSTLRFEPFAQTRAGLPVFANEIGTGRYGPEASGGLVVYPPGIGGEQIYDGLSPSSRTQAALILYGGTNARVDLSLGTPCYDTGSIKNGYRIRLSSDGRSLTFDKANGACVIDEVPPLVIDDTAQELRLYGVPVMTGTGGGSTPKNYLTGFLLTQPDFAGTPSIVDVSAGICRDSTGAYDINVGDPSTDYLTNGGPLFNDALVGTDTVITGTVTNAALESGITSVTFTASLLAVSGIPSRALTGNVDLAAPDLSGTSTMTPNVAGTTRFLSELQPGDLVGDGTNGYVCVLAVDSNSSARVKRTSSLAPSVTNATFTVYENLQIKVGSGASKRVATLTSNGLTAGTFGQLNSNVNAAGLAVVVGQPCAGGKTFTDTAARVYTFGSWILLWAVRTSGGTASVTWSTQRTTPYSPATLSGYTIRRRVNVLPIHTDNFVPQVTQYDLGAERLTCYEGSSTDYNWAVVTTGAGAGAWTSVWAGYSVPPTASSFEAWLQVAPAGATRLQRVRPGGAGSSSTTRPHVVQAPSGGINSDTFRLGVDAGQHFDQAGTTSSGEWLLSTVGYYDKP